MDQRERDQMVREIGRLRGRQASLKGILTGLDPEKDEKQIQSLITENSGIEGEIASLEMKL